MNLKAFLLILRPVNCIITVLSVVIAGIISNARWMDFSPELALAGVSAALIAGGGNAYNDYRDRHLDAVQKKHRPLPAGVITPSAALIWSAVCLFAGVIVAAWVGSAAFGIAACAALLLILYSRFWKGQPLFGNVVVALVAALALIYGGIAVRSVGPALWAALLAFLFHLGREIIKDLADLPGDLEHGIRTLPAVWGVPAARLSITSAFFLLAVALPLPYYLGNYRLEYMVTSILGVLPVLVVVTWFVWKRSRPEQWHLLGLIVKLDMLVGLAALYFGRPLEPPG
jgi:geranylgeranylglycerol-phosphate geranylgeranyltransferase